jgi:hypothetical protein
MTGPTLKVRRLVLERDEWTCQRCGQDISDGDYSLQHRRARGMGGSKAADTNLPANLITVCGSATNGCHGRIESDPLRAATTGFRLPQGADPEAMPVQTWRGKALLSNDGMLALVAQDEGQA